MGGHYSIVGLVFGQFTQASNYGKAGYLSKAAHWRPSELEVDLSGKVFLITGANSGLGKQVALELAKRKGIVHLLCRNEERGRKALEEIKETSQNPSIQLHVLDVGVLSDVRNFSSSFLATGSPIHCLIHNAGALPTKREETSEGNESTLASQVLGPFLLTSLLSERLKETKDSQVIWVTSAGMYTQRLRLDNIQSTKQPFDGTVTYAQMKRAQVILTEMWADKFKESGVRVNSVHPGWTVTPGLDSLFEVQPVYKRFLSSFRSVEQGADGIVWLAMKSELGTTGKLYFDREEQPTSIRFARTDSSPEERRQLWELCSRLTGDNPAKL